VASIAWKPVGLSAGAGCGGGVVGETVVAETTPPMSNDVILFPTSWATLSARFSCPLNYARRLLLHCTDNGFDALFAANALLLRYGAGSDHPPRVLSG